MKLYFIIVCYNNKDLLDTCLGSIREQSLDDIGVIVVDNGSKDGSGDYITSKYKEVELVALDDNQGFAIANNIGIKKALENDECEYIALLNTDATVDKDWSKKLINFAQKNPKSASLQTPTLDYYDHKILDSRGITIDMQGRPRQLGHREIYKKRESHKVFGVNAAACIFTAEFLKEQTFDGDYFDHDMWMYLEDVDIAARATMSGWKNWYVTGSFAYHMGSASSSKNPGFSVFMSYRNNLPLLIKNLPASYLIVTMFGAIATDIETLINLSKSKNFIPIKAIIKGRMASLNMIPLFVRKRRQFNPYRNIDKKTLKQLMKAI